MFVLSIAVKALGDERFAAGLQKASRSDREAKVRRKALETYYELASSAESSSAISKLREEVGELREENRKLARAAG